MKFFRARFTASLFLCAFICFFDQNSAMAQQLCSTYTTQCACLAPCVWNAGTCGNPSNLSNACDDGSGSGNPSIVAKDVVGGNTAAKFQNVVNRKLACCLNTLDILNPATPLKYDCVDNSAPGAGVTFDTLWESSDPVDSGGQANALLLSAGGGGITGGTPVSGFYSLSGGRCGGYSEFGGPTLRSAKVNPAQASSQQEKAAAGSDACTIVPGTYSATPPAVMVNVMMAKGKTIPYDGTSTSNCAQAAAMRQCPILVRAVAVYTCPKNAAPPQIQNSYVDTSNKLHCQAAANVRIHVRMEQIYEIAGTERMPLVDTVMDQGKITQLSVSNLIMMKVGNLCPPGMVFSNGACSGCPDGCGGTRCSACQAGTFYSGAAGFAPQCKDCAVGTYSGPQASTCLACTNTPGGYFWTGHSTTPTCPTARCTAGGTGFGGTSPTCP